MRREGSGTGSSAGAQLGLRVVFAMITICVARQAIDFSRASAYTAWARGCQGGQPSRGWQSGAHRVRADACASFSGG